MADPEAPSVHCRDPSSTRASSSLIYSGPNSPESWPEIPLRADSGEGNTWRMQSAIIRAAPRPAILRLVRDLPRNGCHRTHDLSGRVIAGQERFPNFAVSCGELPPDPGGSQTESRSSRQRLPPRTAPIRRQIRGTLPPVHNRSAARWCRSVAEAYLLVDLQPSDNRGMRPVRLWRESVWLAGRRVS